jgi:hypothetical protein
MRLFFRKVLRKVFLFISFKWRYKEKLESIERISDFYHSKYHIQLTDSGLAWIIINGNTYFPTKGKINFIAEFNGSGKIVIISLFSKRQIEIDSTVHDSIKPFKLIKTQHLPFSLESNFQLSARIKTKIKESTISFSQNEFQFNHNTHDLTLNIPLPPKIPFNNEKNLL